MKIILAFFALSSLAFAQSVTICPNNAASCAPAFSGTGLNDPTITGPYVGVAANHDYTATVASTGGTDTINYARDGVAAIGPYAMSTGYQPMYYLAGTVTGVSWSAGRATYAFGSPHGLSTGALVTVTGAAPSGYNVTLASLLVIDSAHFSVALAVNPGSWISGGVATGNDGIMDQFHRKFSFQLR